jgi:hypothetical protein
LSSTAHFFAYGQEPGLLHYELADAEGGCQSVQTGPTLNNPYAMQEEHYAILVCRGSKIPSPKRGRA